MSVVAPDGIARLVQISSVLLPHNAVRGRMTAHGDISIDTFKEKAVNIHRPPHVISVLFPDIRMGSHGMGKQIFFSLQLQFLLDSHLES